MIRSLASPARGLVAAATLALGGSAAGQQQTPAAGKAGTSDAFERACIDLIHGKTPKGAQAIEALRKACADLTKARAEERRRAEQQRQAQAQLREELRMQQLRVKEGGQSAAPVEPGQSAVAAFALAGNELVGSRPRGAPGFSRAGQPFGSTVTTNPIGWFTGIGVNAELLQSFAPQFSWTAGGHYSQSAATARTLYTLGFLGGVDWFMLGQYNSGLRIGPRLDLSFGRESSTSTSTSARLGLTGEVGYNFISTNGITGMAAFGLGGRVAGDKNEQLSSAVGGEFGPYVKLGVGYSW